MEWMHLVAISHTLVTQIWGNVNVCVSHLSYKWYYLALVLAKHILMEWIPKPFNTHAKQADMEWFPTQFNTNAKCLGASICCRTAAGCILMPLFTIQSCYIRAQQLRKLGKLLCYYLDKFNHIRVLICHKQKCKAALQSGPRSKGVLLPGLRWILELLTHIWGNVKFYESHLSYKWCYLALVDDPDPHGMGSTPTQHT